MTAATSADASITHPKPVFIHISKNAGTSIIRSAGDTITSAGHQTADRWIARHGREQPLFAVIRNPFDRVLSEYSYRRGRYEGGEANPHLANLDRPFDAWVRSTFRDGEYRTRSFFDDSGVSFNEFNMVDDCLIWFQPQTRWIGDGGVRLVDELLRFEHLDDDWRAFCLRHGIDRRLGHANFSQRDRDYRAYYTDESREIVWEYYRVDFEAFGYT